MQFTSRLLFYTCIIEKLQIFHFQIITCYFQKKKNVIVLLLQTVNTFYFYRTKICLEKCYKKTV